jgi:hypothetical protein
MNKIELSKESKIKKIIKSKIIFMYYSVFFMIICLLFIGEQINAQPVITGISSSSISNGDYILITGIDFGMGDTSPLLWEDFENGNVGDVLSSSPKIGSWSLDGFPIYSSDQSNSGNKSAKGTGINTYTAMFRTDFTDESKFFISYWWRYNLAGPTTGGQVKVVQLKGTCHGACFGATCPDYNPGFFLGDATTQYDGYWTAYIALETGDCFSHTSSALFNHGEPGQDQWHFIELELQQSDFNVSDGQVKVWVDGILEYDQTNVITRTLDNGGGNERWDFYQFFYGMTNLGSSCTGTHYVDDAYMNNAWNRVIIGDSENYDNCSHIELQIPTEWSNDSINVTINQGSFQDGDTAYIYVVDSVGSISNGYQIVFSGSGIVNNNIKVYPNPCMIYMGHNSIMFNNLSSNDIIKIYNITGKLVHNSGNLTNNDYRWSVNDILSGVYFYKITGSNKAKGKIVIIR